MDLAVDFVTTLPLLLDGLVTTLIICIVSMIIASVIAVPIVLARRSRSGPLRKLVAGWVALNRSLPIVILIFLLYFGLPALLGLGRLSPYWIGIAALSINGSAFLSEVLRAAINRVPAGQWESAASLGLGPAATWIKVVLPQAMRIALPALMGELTLLVKASPALSLITVVDLTRRSQQVAMQTFDPLVPMLAAATLYFVVLYGLSLLSRLLERRIALVGHNT